MFIPAYYKNEDDLQILSFLQENSFGTLIHAGKEFPFVTHCIFEIIEQENSKFTLRSHLAKGNPQWKMFAENPNVLCVFQGSHTYISSSWYSIPEVPTWNYISVQIQGRVKIINDEAIVLDHLKTLVNKYEKTTQTNLDLEKLPHKVVFGQMKGLVAFDIEIIKTEAAYKLSQNRNEKDFVNIIHSLHDLNKPESEAIAKEMENIKCPFQQKS